MRFRVLGPFEVLGATGPLSFAPRQRIVVSMLLLEPNRVVAIERLVDAVWNTAPPSTAKEQIQICVSAIRRTLAAAGLPGAIVTRPPGYAIECTDEQLDLLAFDRLVAAGRQAVAQRHDSAAVEAFGSALALWRGTPLAGVRSELVQSIGTVLAERRLAAVEEHIDVRLRLGHQHELVSELAELVAANPFREQLRAQLMLALYRSGRRAEALAAYRSCRELFVDKLGLEPGAELLQVEQAILAGDAGPVLGQLGPVTVPRLLPADIGDFTGRRELVERVRVGLCGPRDAGLRAVRIVAIAGRPWLGKTVLAVHVAHTLAEEFPDGQMFVRVGAARTGEVLARFLGALGVASIPDGVEERAEMYRNLLSDRRMLVILDDVAAERQVLPLLPGSPTCAVLVTSRARLTALGGATVVDVGPLAVSEAVELLAGTLGRDRARAESGELARLAEVCAGEPLALRLAAARLGARPHWPVGTLVARLSDDTRRLTELSHGGFDLVDAITGIWESLSDAAQRLLGRIVLVGRTGLLSWMCAPLLDMDERSADDALIELVDAGLLDVERTPDRQVVFHLRGLLRVFAKARVAVELSQAEQAEILRRVFGTRLVLAVGARARHDRPAPACVAADA